MAHFIGQAVCRKLWTRAAWHLLAASIAGAPVASQIHASPGGDRDAAFITIVDHPDDAVARRSDPGADGPIDPSGLDRIELLRIHLGLWSPTTPHADLFAGTWSEDGEFFKLELEFAGLVNPPGPSHPSDFDPCRYGERPVFGFVELDMDGSTETGGELDAPQYRYTGNAVRFGGLPSDPVFEDRVALDASAFDGDIQTPPYVDRSGEEFHLAFLEKEIDDDNIERIVGNMNDQFESGEVWRLDEELFHRAHGFEPFSLAYGSNSAGEYEPDCKVEFRHDMGTNVTHVGLVYQLSPVGAGLVENEAPEPWDHDTSNQTSVLEALEDLRASAELLDMFPSGDPDEAVIIEWRNREPQDYLDPRLWRVTAIVGAAYTAPDPRGEFLVWTDLVPNVVRGDVNGDGVADDEDRQEIEAWVAAEDGSDGQLDGRAEVAGFGLNFHVYDVNHDGVVDGWDARLTGACGDANDDGRTDLFDFAALQACYSGPGTPFPSPECTLLDLDSDGDVDGVDARRWIAVQSGP